MNDADHSGQEFLYDLKSAKEAADYLRVSESTVWRYVAQDIVPAYRLGQKRVWFKRSDLDNLVKPLTRRRRAKYNVDTTAKSLNLVTIESGSRGSWAAMARVNTVRENILNRRAGAVFSDSVEEINAAREARSEDL